MEDLYKTLGDAKCRELTTKEETLWKMLKLSESRKSTQVRGAMFEGIARDFIREFLPTGFGLKSGLVFDAESKTTSPQCDAIIYKGAPLLEFTDVAVIEKEQVKAIFEIRGWVDQPSIFGAKSRGLTNPNSGLAYEFKQKKEFLPLGAKYVLFAFNVYSSSSIAEVIERLNKVCHSYAIVIRYTPKREQKEGKERWTYNFNNSVSELIKWLRNLS